MYLVSDKNGPIATFKDQQRASIWAEKFGWTLQPIEDGDVRDPICLVTGYMNLLEPTKKPTFQDKVISFDHSRKSFLNAELVKEGDLYFRANLENYFFCVPVDFDVINEAIKFWQDLRKRGLDLVRQVNGQFKIVRVSPGTSIESEVNLTSKLDTIKQSVGVNVIKNPVLPGGSEKPPETI